MRREATRGGRFQSATDRPLRSRTSKRMYRGCAEIEWRNVQMNSVSSISVHAMPRCSNNSRNAFTYLSVVNFCVNVRQKFSFTQFTSTSMGVGFALGVAILGMPYRLTICKKGANKDRLTLQSFYCGLLASRKKPSASRSSISLS